MNWKPGTPLRPGQTRFPILWTATLAELRYPELTTVYEPEWFTAFWGDDRQSRRIRSFGHRDPADHASPHYLCTRGGIEWHTDPGYTRYALQIQLWNQGFIVHGLGDDLETAPLFTPGRVTLLDTWSPHQVARDPRLPELGINKLLVGADFAKRPRVRIEVARLIHHLRTKPP